MTKEQFLHDLTVQLNLNVSDQVIHEQLAYYDNYISGEVRNGRSEAEVVQELGSPRLLAKTIIETAEAAGDPVASQDEEIRGTIDTEPYSDAFDYERSHAYGSGQNEPYSSQDDNAEPTQNYENESRGEQQSYSEDGVRNDNGRSSFGSFFGDRNESSQNGSHYYGHVFNTGSWGCLVFMIIFFLILELLIMLLGGILELLSPILVPMMIAGLVVWMISKFLK
ncbi:DUF1700 domain-containing protein [Oribacterium sp. WCC10]|uniref:DUF1700 domain-containing protein n=1 Tax=Oribacterium sp. WCC10 TaxID=1855343 RepID=UPI0008DF4416|nr:DUF1700 domain-containing protein [Oribacterium sp. WCC10]SFG31256.1 Protein of unknown function [Oribacterium sp. WCC10]